METTAVIAPRPQPAPRPRRARGGVRSATVCAALALLCASLRPASARAQEGAAFDVRYEQGRALRASHRDAEALQHFQALYEETRDARALAQVALAEGALGHWIDAESHLAAVLALSGDAWVDVNRDAAMNLRAALASIRTHLGSVEVTADVPGAELRVAGRRVGGLPLAQPVRAVAGEVVVEVGAPGHVAVSRVVTLPAGELVREHFQLVREPERSPPAVGDAAPAPAPPAPATPAPALAPLPPRRVDAPSGTALRTAAWATAGGSLLLLAGGAVAAAVGASAADRWNDDALCLPSSGTRRAACEDDFNTASTLQGLSIGAFIAGGALAVTASVLFIVAPRRRAAAVSCGPSTSAPGVVCAGRF